MAKIKKVTPDQQVALEDSIANPIDLGSPNDPAIMSDQEPANFDVGLPAAEEPVQPNGLPTSLVEGAKTSQQRLQEMLNDPNKQALLQKLQAKSEEALKQQQQGVSQNETSLQQMQDQGPQVNWAPALNYIDHISGSSLAKNYQQPESPQAYQEKLLSLRDALQKQKQGLTQEQLNLLKAQVGMGGVKDLQAMARLDQRGQTLGMAQDRAAAQAVKDIDNHPLMVESNRQLGILQRDRATAQEGKITSQMLREMSNGIAQALAGGKSVGLESGNIQDMSTAQTKLAQWESYLSNNPHEAASSQVRAQIIDTLNRLEAAYGKYQANMAQKLSVGRTYNNNPQAQAAIKAAVGKYSYTPNAPVLAPKSKPQPQSSGGPKVGDVEDGHKFLGGNPADPKSWAEVK